MKLHRPLAVIDIEGTSLDVSESRIVEFACAVLKPDGSRMNWVQRFKPDIPIPAEATAVHGITDADVAGCPPFKDYAAKILKGLEGKDIGGYNLRGYDLPVLDEEARRAGLRLSIEGVNVIDAFGIFSNKEKRDLSSAVQKYCGRSHEGAHGAGPDAQATADVIEAQLSFYPDLAEMSLADLAKFSMRGDFEAADLAGKLHFDAEGKICYSFGKNKGSRVEDEPGFGLWMLRQRTPPFPGSTVEVLTAELRRIGAI